MVNKMQNKEFDDVTMQATVKLTVLLFVCFLISQANFVWAHTSLVKSDPPRRASLSESPAQIQLWFSEAIEAEYISVNVLDWNEKVVSLDEPEVVEDDPKSIVLAMPKLVSGSYKVKYRVLSIDGHVFESSYGFRVKNN